VAALQLIWGSTLEGAMTEDIVSRVTKSHNHQTSLGQTHGEMERFWLSIKIKMLLQFITAMRVNIAQFETTNQI
jgi:hypothetical protein